MKNEKGITLTSLVIYILVFSMIMTAVGSLSSFFTQNLKRLDTDSISSEEFNKFNTYFIKDVKESKMASVNKNQNNIEIILENGNKYTYVKSENSIYKQSMKIARSIIKFDANIIEENNKKIVKIDIATGTNEKKPNFEKNIKYVLKYW